MASLGGRWLGVRKGQNCSLERIEYLNWLITSLFILCSWWSLENVLICSTYMYIIALLLTTFTIVLLFIAYIRVIQLTTCIKVLLFTNTCSEVISTHVTETCLERSRWCNGLARMQQWPCYLQGPSLSPTYDQQSFVTHQSNPDTNICAMTSNNVTWKLWTTPKNMVII